jgi:hypothetical protein
MNRYLVQGYMAYPATIVVTAEDEADAVERARQGDWDFIYSELPEDSADFTPDNAAQPQLLENPVPLA